MKVEKVRDETHIFVLIPEIRGEIAKETIDFGLTSLVSPMLNEMS